MTDILLEILKAMLTAAVPVLTAFLCGLIHKAAAWFGKKLKNDQTNAYMSEIRKAVISAVNYVNQTFVDALKDDPEAEFDAEQQEAAFEEAYRTAVETISDAALAYLTETFGDVRKYLTVKIEEAVRECKKR